MAIAPPPTLGSRAPLGPMGVAPPPVGRSTGGRKRAEGLMDAARKLLEQIPEFPEFADQLNDIVERLTGLIRRSLEPPELPEGAGEAGGEPTLDTTSAGPSPGGAGSTSPLAALSRY